MHCVLLIQPVLNTMKFVQFQVLSTISCEGDVFDNLLPVKRLDTLEEGLLLCSHYCQWPAELLPKADFIEGCFTPEEHRNDPRLVLGSHPGDITKWEVKEQDEGVILTLYLKGDNPTARMPRPMEVYDTSTAFFPRSRVMDRLWRNAERAAPTRYAALISYYDSLSQLVESGRILPIVAATYMPKGMPLNDVFNYVNFTGGRFHNFNVAGYYDRIHVRFDEPEEGFLVAIPLSEKPSIPGKVIGWRPTSIRAYKYRLHFHYVEA